MTKRDGPEHPSIEMIRHGDTLIHSGAIRSGFDPPPSVLRFPPPAGGSPVSIAVAPAREGTIYVRHSPIYEDVSRVIEDVLARCRWAELEAERSKGFWRRLFSS